MMVDFCKIFEDKSIQLVSEIAESLGIEAFVVGGYVRDLILGRPSKDIDILTIGKDSSEILSTAVKNKIGKYAHLSVFKTFGTAQVKWGKNELEFVRATVMTAETRNVSLALLKMTLHVETLL